MTAGREEARDARDRQLLERIVAKDVAAFEALHARYFGPLHGFAMRFVRRPDRAEEVANDALMAVWRGADRFEGRAKVSTWIFGIAYRTALKAVRRADPSASHVDIDEAVAVPDPSVVEPEVRMDRDRAATALQALPVEQRAIMELTYFYGHTITEIAEITGIPPGTIKSRMHAARRRLREALA